MQALRKEVPAALASRQTALSIVGITKSVILPGFDLTHVSARVAKEHPDWSSDRLETAVLQYREFMVLAKMTRTALVPTPDADEVWHAHILHTQAYARDCKKFVGRFVHHSPTLSGANHERERAETKRLYEQVFGKVFPAGRIADSLSTPCTSCMDA